MNFVRPTSFKEAIQKFGQRSPVGSIFTASEWSDVPLALRERAFFSSRVESLRFLQRAQGSMGDFLKGSRETVQSPRGVTSQALKTGSRAQFVDQMQGFLEGEGIRRTHGGLTDLAGQRRLGLIFDTNVRQAHDYGQWLQGQNEAVLQEFPAQRFIRVIPVKERRNLHIDAENMVKLKTDLAFWRRINEDFGTPWGPWGWGCGHDVEDVDRDEAEELGLIQPEDRVEPAVEHFNEQLAASTKGLSNELIDMLRQGLGNKIIIQGDQVRWKRAGSKARQIVGPEVIVPRPVSDGLKVRSAVPRLTRQVTHAIALIDQVHTDGKLPQIPIIDVDTSYEGAFIKNPFTLRPEKIEVSINSKLPTLATIHEIGHFLDYWVMDKEFSYASSNAAFMIPFLRAASRTTALQEMVAFYQSPLTSQSGQEFWSYCLRPSEIWARAYAQYVVMKTQDRAGLDEIAFVRSYNPHIQWSDADFQIMLPEIEKILRDLNWLLE